MSKSIQIPQPKALPGEDVSVENYRMRPPLWEHGQCHRADFIISRPGAGRWQYTVILNRESPSGRDMRLYVGDARIERDS